MQTLGQKRSLAIERMKKEGKTPDQIRSYLRGWDQLDNRKGKSNDKSKRKNQ